MLVCLPAGVLLQAAPQERAQNLSLILLFNVEGNQKNQNSRRRKTQSQEPTDPPTLPRRQEVRTRAGYQIVEGNGRRILRRAPTLAPFTAPIAILLQFRL